MKYEINDNKIKFKFTAAEAKLINASIGSIRETRNIQLIKQMRAATNFIKMKQYKEFDDLIQIWQGVGLYDKYLIEEELMKNRCLEVSLTEDWLDSIIDIVIKIESYEQRKKLLKELIKLLKEDINPNCSEIKTQEYIEKCKSESKVKKDQFLII